MAASLAPPSAVWSNPQPPVVGQYSNLEHARHVLLQLERELRRVASLVRIHDPDDVLHSRRMVQTVATALLKPQTRPTEPIELATECTPEAEELFVYFHKDGRRGLENTGAKEWLGVCRNPRVMHANKSPSPNETTASPQSKRETNIARSLRKRRLSTVEAEERQDGHKRYRSSRPRPSQKHARSAGGNDNTPPMQFTQTRASARAAVQEQRGEATESSTSDLENAELSEPGRPTGIHSGEEENTPTTPQSVISAISPASPQSPTATTSQTEVTRTAPDRIVQPSQRRSIPMRGGSPKSDEHVQDSSSFSSLGQVGNSADVEIDGAEPSPLTARSTQPTETAPGVSTITDEKLGVKEPPQDIRNGAEDISQHPTHSNSAGDPSKKPLLHIIGNTGAEPDPTSTSPTMADNDPLLHTRSVLGSRENTVELPPHFDPGHPRLSAGHLFPPNISLCDESDESAVRELGWQFYHKLLGKEVEISSRNKPVVRTFDAQLTGDITRFFFSEVMGPDALSRLSLLIQDYCDSELDDSISMKTILQAETLAESADTPEEMRPFLLSFSKSNRSANQLKKSQNKTALWFFKNICHSLEHHQDYRALMDRKKDLALATKLQRLGYCTAPGKGVETCAVEWLSHNLGMTKTLLKSRCSQYETTALIVERFGPGIITVLPAFTASRTSKWGVARTKVVLSLLEDLTPYIRPTVAILEQCIYKPILAEKVIDLQLQGPSNSGNFLAALQKQISHHRSEYAQDSTSNGQENDLLDEDGDSDQFSNTDDMNSQGASVTAEGVHSM